MTLILILFFSFLTTVLNAEIIIYKRMQNHIKPLDTSDKKNWPKLFELLKKYSWPMCLSTMAQIPKAEKDELFKPNQANAEENFLRKKVRAIDRNYDVAFFPTTLFELFILKECYSETLPFRELFYKAYDGEYSKLPRKELIQSYALKGSSAAMNQQQKNTLKTLLKNETEFKNLPERSRICALEFAITMLDPAIDKIVLDNKKTIQDVLNLYDQQNKLAESAYFEAHTKIIGFLTKNTISLPLSLDQAKNIAQKLIIEAEPCWAKKKRSFESKKDGFEEEHGPAKTVQLDQNTTIPLFHIEGNPLDLTILNKEIQNNTLNKDGIIAKTLECEFREKSKNQVMIIRGTSGIEQVTKKIENKNTGQIEEKHQLIDSPLYIITSQNVPEMLEELKTSKNYTSLSYANSLFAGAYYDDTACTYYYLARPEDPVKFPYALEFYKAEYVVSQCKKLFFISSLGTLAALFTQGGEFFHSRSKVAVNEIKPYIIKGIVKFDEEKIEEMVKQNIIIKDMSPFSIPFDDKIGYLLIKRNPIEHAELFFNFLSENMVLLQETSETKKELEQAHKLASELYTILVKFRRTLAARVEKIRTKSAKSTTNLTFISQTLRTLKTKLMQLLIQLKKIQGSN